MPDVSWGGVRQPCRQAPQCGGAGCEVGSAPLLLLGGCVADRSCVIERETDSPKRVVVLVTQLRDHRSHALLEALLQVGACPPDLAVGELRNLVEHACPSPLCLAWHGFSGNLGHWGPKPDTGIEVVPELTAGTQHCGAGIDPKLEVEQITCGGAQVGQLGGQIRSRDVEQRSQSGFEVVCAVVPPTVDLLAYQLHDEGPALRFNSGGFHVVQPAVEGREHLTPTPFPDSDGRSRGRCVELPAHPAFGGPATIVDVTPARDDRLESLAEQCDALG